MYWQHTVTSATGDRRVREAVVSPLSAAGAVDASAGKFVDCDLVARHGRLPMSAVLAPAIELAERGFPVAPITAHAWAAGAQRQLQRSAAGAAHLRPTRAP